ncbi:hypothetical protein [Stieleria varia]|uniref:Protein BatD n=1 Tax=Stieleria varia TaxID=2528005 RepID=A0A5C6A093_9BACT|nr:hypothetical protein [Stieleria varia]TWT91953.1 hypothetical protein Pla52n_64260 [Stieleria varia]
MNRTLCSVLVCWMLTLTIHATWANDSSWVNNDNARIDDDAILLTVKRGLTGQLTFSHASPTLQAIPNQSIDSEVLVRLERSTTDSPLRAGQNRYTLRFFGTVAGDYDLSKWVVQRDGSALLDADSLPPMTVRVVSELPPGHGTSLYEIDDPMVHASGGYRVGLVCFAVLWVMVPVVWSLVRRRASQPETVTPAALPPTLADRLRPLIERASQGLLSVDEQSRLELLLYVFWQRRLGLPASMAKALPILRNHAEAGGLLRTLESWIHSDAHESDGGVSAKTAGRTLSPATMDALLAPYHASLQSDADTGQKDLHATDLEKIGSAV